MMTGDASRASGVDPSQNSGCEGHLQAQFTLNLGYAVANAAQMPAWNPQDPLSKVRR